MIDPTSRGCQHVQSDDNEKCPVKWAGTALTAPPRPRRS